MSFMDCQFYIFFSYNISNIMDVKLVAYTLNNAILCYKKPDILNTDHGSQYTSFDYIAKLSSLNIKISMD